MRDASDKSCCGRIKEQIFKIFLVLAMFSLLGFFWIQHSVAQDKYLISPEKTDNFNMLMKVFIGTYVILYVVMSCQVFSKYREKRKICSFTNCTFSTVSLLIIYFSFWFLKTTYSDKTRYETDFNQSCDDIAYNLDNTSVFQEADQINDRAGKLLCSQACPCTLKRARIRQL